MKWRTSGEKYMGNKFHIMKKLAGQRTNANKTLAWNGVKYVKKTSWKH